MKSLMSVWLIGENRSLRILLFTLVEVLILFLFAAFFFTFVAESDQLKEIDAKTKELIELQRKTADSDKLIERLRREIESLKETNRALLEELDAAMGIRPAKSGMPGEEMVEIPKSELEALKRVATQFHKEHPGQGEGASYPFCFEQAHVLFQVTIMDEGYRVTPMWGVSLDGEVRAVPGVEALVSSELASVDAFTRESRKVLEYSNSHHCRIAVKLSCSMNNNTSSFYIDRKKPISDAFYVNDCKNG